MSALLDSLCEGMASKSADQIRNVCLIAHVDHGKTSFADSLVSTNGIISNRMAGHMRFMDSRDDEQSRGITMKASGVSLLYGPMLVNLMDSPGHVDFSSEVTSALLLSDIALLLVDVIEGVCSQTQALLRQAITNRQTVILVINKLDRLRIELKMTSSEAYSHIARLVEAVNSCVSQVVAGTVLEDDSWGNIEELEAELHFDPVKGNVIFSSAIHGYAFGVEDFAEIYYEKVKIPKEQLIKGLFGDFYMQPGEIRDGAFAKGRKTVFELFILDPLWALHDCGLVSNDLPKLTALAEKISVSFKSRRVEEAFDEIMRNWMPVSRAAFRSCARATSARMAFYNPQRLRLLIGNKLEHPLADSIVQCSPDGKTVVFVVKFFRSNDKKLAICRVLSGRVKPGDELFVLGKKARNDDDEALRTTVKGVWMLRGRDCIILPSVAAGAICAIDAEGIVQNATLCSEDVKEGLAVGREMGEPLVRVSVNPIDLDQADDLKAALKLLAFLDPSLRVLELETGELAMVTAGEVHLEKCVRDLADLGFVNLEISAPIVPFLETIVADPTVTQAQIQEQVTECRLRGEALYLRLRAVSLPEEIVSFLDKNNALLQSLRRGNVEADQLSLFRSKLEGLCVAVLPHLKGSWWYKKTKEEIVELVEKVWSFGPDRARANILFNAIPDYARKSIWGKDEGVIRPLDQAIVSGFELFVNSGPLCNEVVRGVAIVVEEFTVDTDDAAMSGQLLSAMRSVCKVATEKLGLRLVAAMYKCIVTTASQALGKVHSVLAQRKAKIVNEDINEATGLFEVEALLPVVESFSFCDHLRTNTSGMASAQLEFSHWQIIDEDPYWVPSTLEEVEEFGLKGDSPNHARGYMDAVRRRKGLPTEDLIVQSAEKQRNLKKNK